MPENYGFGNSQTMSLLESYININPRATGGPILAIVDDTALSTETEDSGYFIDAGQSGTGQISTYTVRQGDTLSSIAKMFKVSVNTILWANDIRNGKISLGQELVILPISGVRHVVKSGDTIASVARKYNATQGDILSYNGLTSSSKLSIGQEIIIPDGEKPSAPASSNATAKIVSGLKEALGYYLRPIVGGRKSQGIHGYNGVDLAAPVGTPIMASAEGTVVIARSSGYNGGYGLYVAIKHQNGTQTVYGHMSKVNVSVGQNVEQGQVIGAVGNTGHSTGPHLHFEIRGARNPF